MSKRQVRLAKVQKKAEPPRLPKQILVRQHQSSPIQAVAPRVAYQRARISGSGLRTADLLALQRAVGNRAVQRMVAQRIDNSDGQQQAEITKEKRGVQAQTRLIASPLNAINERQAEEVVQGRSSEELLTAYTRTAGAKLRAQSPIQRQANSFESVGYGVKGAAGQAETITRPEQVLLEYGITCYGTSVMFMIQSYGLIPPNMSRAEFEYAFTPLNPGSNHTAPKAGAIKVGGTEQPGAMPVDLITKALEGTENPRKRNTSIGTATATEATLRGADQGGFSVANIMKQMPKILAAFKAQSEKKGYEFMKAYVPVSGKSYTPNKTEEKWEEGSTQLEAGTINADYFKAGNTILVGINYHYPPGQSAGHWVVIVREKEETKTIAGQSYHLYPADDPLWGRVYVMAPLLGRVSSAALNTAGLHKNGYLSYNGHRVHMLVRGNAYRRKEA